MTDRFFGRKVDRRVRRNIVFNKKNTGAGVLNYDTAINVNNFTVACTRRTRCLQSYSTISYNIISGLGFRSYDTLESLQRYKRQDTIIIRFCAEQ